MKQLLTFALSLWMALTVAANPLVLLSGNGPNGGGGGAPVTYLVNEGFEGTGKPAGWTDAEAPNYDYTTNPLAGSQSAKLTTANTQYFLAVFGDEASVWGKMKVRFEASIPTVFFLSINDAAFEIRFRIAALSTGELYVDSGGQTAQTTAQMAPDTTYFVWFRYAKGTGANGIAEARFSATDSKPADGAAGTARITNSSATQDANYFQAVLSATTSVVYDNIQISDATFD